MDNNVFETLTSQEQLFCELFVNGDGRDCKLVGDAFLCYKKAFKVDSDYKALRHSQDLLLRKDIQDYVNFLDCPIELESFRDRHLRRKMTKTLLHIAEECADADYVDRRGNPVSPAALRSVAVNAYKTIASINGLEKKTESEESGNSGGNSGITFNVIVPQDPTKASVEQEETK